MIPLLEAQRLVDAFQASRPAIETVPVEDAVGRVLAEAPASDQDLPPFDRVTMDGYAVRAADLSSPGTLRCIGEVAAGAVAPAELQPGEAYRIMTGAPLPPGADAVVMVEQTREEGDVVHFSESVKPRQNIHPHGGDLRQGDAPLAVGRRITTATLPLLLTLGCREVRVSRRPRVTILTSGDELVEPGARPGPGQIRDSNRLSLAGQVRSAGAEAQCLPIVRDDRDAMRAAVESGLQSDVLLLTGGSSVGRYDYSHEVVAETGARVWFQKVSIKPGKPVLYFTREDRQVFCLPGNPVSAFVTFELLVRPALERRAGLAEVWPVPMSLPAAAELRAPAARDLFQVARINAGAAGWEVEPIRWHGSGDLVSIAAANALARVPAGQAVSVGEPMEVHPLRQAGDDLPRCREPRP